MPTQMMKSVGLVSAVLSIVGALVGLGVGFGIAIETSTQNEKHIAELATAISVIRQEHSALRSDFAFLKGEVNTKLDFIRNDVQRLNIKLDKWEPDYGKISSSPTAEG